MGESEISLPDLEILRKVPSGKKLSTPWWPPLFSISPLPAYVSDPLDITYKAESTRGGGNAGQWLLATKI